MIFHSFAAKFVAHSFNNISNYKLQMIKAYYNIVVRFRANLWSFIVYF